MCEKLGPPRTIAKENRERKEKTAKMPEKCDFFSGDVEIPAKDAVLRAGPRIWHHASDGAPKRSPDESRLPRGQIGVKVRYGFDAAEVIFERYMLVRGMSILVGEAETD